MKDFYFICVGVKILSVSDSPSINSFKYAVPDEFIDGNAVNDLQLLISTPAFLLTALRHKRDTKIAETIWIAERHMTQIVKTLSDEQYIVWQSYWQSLRDVTALDLTGKTLSDLESMLPTVPVM